MGGHEWFDSGLRESSIQLLRHHEFLGAAKKLTNPGKPLTHLCLDLLRKMASFSTYFHWELVNLEAIKYGVTDSEASAQGFRHTRRRAATKYKI